MRSRSSFSLPMMLKIYTTISITLNPIKQEFSSLFSNQYLENITKEKMIHTYVIQS